MDFVCDSDENNEIENDYWSETVVLTPLSSNGGYQQESERFPPVGTFLGSEYQPGSFYNLLYDEQSYGKKEN